MHAVQWPGATKSQNLFNQLAPDSASEVSREEVNVQQIINYYGNIDIKCFSNMKIPEQCSES